MDTRTQTATFIMIIIFLLYFLSLAVAFKHDNDYYALVWHADIELCSDMMELILSRKVSFWWAAVLSGPATPDTHAETHLQQKQSYSKRDWQNIPQIMFLATICKYVSMSKVPTVMAAWEMVIYLHQLLKQNIHCNAWVSFPWLRMLNVVRLLLLRTWHKLGTEAATLCFPLINSGVCVVREWR